MESSSDSYLHKKFKKQLSVEPKNAHQHHHPQHHLHHNQRKNESGAVGNVESGEEKRPAAAAAESECSNNNVTDNQTTTRTDNNEIVPNQSTNNSISSSFAPSRTNVKSSISASSVVAESQEVAEAEAPAANLQSANSCISYQFRPSSFDTPITEPAATAAQVSSTTTTSSILYDANSAQFYTEDNISSKDHNDKRPPLNSESQPASSLPGDKPNSGGGGGKYVCPYCTLVCSKPSVLQKHIRAHTNERPFPCNSCGFSFKTRSNLYKHCRSRTHANRVMGNKAQEMNEVVELTNSDSPPREQMDIDLNKTNKPYKPRFHTAKLFDNQEPPQQQQVSDDKLDDLNSDLLSHHINKIITKNNSIVNSNDAYLLKKRPAANDGDNNNEYYHHHHHQQHHIHRFRSDSLDEPLNLTNKNRKRCMSEVVEPVVQKSLIKELLLKNLNSDMQCPHCKMIFQTVTELELHKLRSCKGFVKPGAKYSRSSSVNVASILTQNKNAFDNIPHLQNAVFPLKSPGPFLGKTRLVESDKNKSFSFDDGMPSAFSSLPTTSNDRFLSLSPLTLSNDKDVRKAAPVKLFGGEVKITHTSGETKSFKIDNKEPGYGEYSGKLSENRVVKSGLQSGGTVLTNKATTPYVKQEPQESPGGIDMQQQCNFVVHDHHDKNVSSSPKYTNMMDFSQQAVKLLTPNLKQPNLRFTFNTTTTATTTTITTPMEYEPTAALTPKSTRDNNIMNQAQDLSRADVVEAFTPKFFHHQQQQSKIVTPHSPNLYNPLSLLVNGKVVRYVPGIPGPVAAEEPIEYTTGGSNSAIISTTSKRDDQHHQQAQTPDTPLGPPAQPVSRPKDINNTIIKPPAITFSEAKKFARPNSLALKPTTASLKQHHGLTPTMFNQILISPDTPRVAKKYVQQFLHGNYFSYLGLKCSTKPVYCTLNKTQPFYVPHFKKLSMYSEWRQQDTKTDKLYVGGYDSRQKQRGYVTAGKAASDLVVHSSYKFVVSPDSPNGKDGKAASSEGGGELQKTNNNNNNNNNTPTILGGYECNDDYTYIRGRGRGRYVCDQCGIRCKKPSMLKKHIRTHSNDRPYTCSHCNFSFKTKGNLTKHMKSKAHTKNSVAGGSSSSSTQQSGTQSSESDTDDSGMDSSDESTRREEHEAAYGLLSLAQKSSTVNTTDHHHHHHRKDTLSPTPSTVSLSSTEAHSTHHHHHHQLPIGNNVMNTEEIAYVFKSNYAKNKILDEKNSFTAPKMMLHQAMGGGGTTIGGEIPTTSEQQQQQQQTNELRNLTRYLGKTTTGRPLTYPYNTSIQTSAENGENDDDDDEDDIINDDEPSKNIKQFHVIQKYAPPAPPPPLQSPNKALLVTKNEAVARPKAAVQLLLHHPPPILKVNDVVMDHRLEPTKKRPPAFECDSYAKAKLHRADMEVMDLSMPTTTMTTMMHGDKSNGRRYNSNGSPMLPMEEEIVYPPLNPEQVKMMNNEVYSAIQRNHAASSEVFQSPMKRTSEEDYGGGGVTGSRKTPKLNGIIVAAAAAPVPVPPASNVADVNFAVEPQRPLLPINNDSPKSYKSMEYDNSAMETLAEIATKQVKLEKNTLAKSVASEFLKLATKNESEGGASRGDAGPYAGLGNKDVGEMIVKSEGSKSCSVCLKNFSKPSQLRLHMNIHYLERPFRCHSCSVSFRTKGHLQKHERSASHHNKLSSSPALSSSEPRPFKCIDCNIAFRIHGHLAKHLRSKMHIMKLECLAKIPFGLYAELERSNSLLTEINTADGDQCLESLKTLAKKVFINDPNKLNQLDSTADTIEADS